jgi:hypothetical protein
MLFESNQPHKNQPVGFSRGSNVRISRSALAAVSGDQPVTAAVPAYRQPGLRPIG